MINNPHIPVFYEIEQIENHLNTFETNELKLDYLMELYNEYVTVCYYLPNKQIGNYLKSKNLDTKFYAIDYIPSIDKYQTHISMSKYIRFLRLIDKELLPYVRKEIKKLNRSFKEDQSKIIKDYPVFGFDRKKMLEYIDTLTVNKISYIKQIIKKRIESIVISNPHIKSDDDFEKVFKNDDLYVELNKMLNLYERYPERLYERNLENKKTGDNVPELFRKDKSLCEFKLEGIKEYAKKYENTSDAILYLLHVNKEALQNSGLIPNTNSNNSFLTNLVHEIDFYEKKQRMEKEILKELSPQEVTSSVPEKEPIRLHWKSDNILIPYLMDRLFEEGLISKSDFELKSEFIEQSFYKKNGSLFTQKESRTTESNYKNFNINNRPKNYYKVERVINSLKSKSDEIREKKASRKKTK